MPFEMYREYFLSSKRFSVYRRLGMTGITFIMFLAAIFGGIPIVTKSPECLIISRALAGLHCGKNLRYMDKLSTEAGLLYYFL